MSNKRRLGEYFELVHYPGAVIDSLGNTQDSDIITLYRSSWIVELNEPMHIEILMT